MALPYTCLSVIEEAFQEIGVTVPGETLTSAMQAKGLAVIKGLISSTGVEGVMNPTMISATPATGALAAGTTEYTVSGPAGGGSFTLAVAPVRLISWKCVLSGFVSAGSFMSMQAFREEVGKRINLAQTSVLPELIGAEQSYSGSSSTRYRIAVYPTPPVSPGTLTFDYYGAIDEPTATSNTLDYPDGWWDYLTSNLAINLAPSYPRVGGVPEALAARAKRSKEVIMQLNATIMGLSIGQGG